MEPQYGTCDLCSRGLQSPQGNLLTTRQIVSNPAYWQKAFALFEGLMNSGTMKAGWVQEAARQTKPWMLCEECAESLGLASREAKEYAHLWWTSGGTFEPPGSGPVPASEVRLGAVPEDVRASGVPRPSRVLLFGRGFVPGEAEAGVAIEGLVRSKGTLTRGHFRDLPVDTEARPAQNREDFFNVVGDIRRWTPNAFILDMLVFDQRTGRDLALVAIWEGADAATARSHFPEEAKARAAALPSAASSARTDPGPARRAPTKRSRVIGWLLVACGALIILSGISIMPRPGSPPIRPPSTASGPGAANQMTPEEAASIPMGLGTVVAGIGVWLVARRRPKKDKPSARHP